MDVVLFRRRPEAIAKLKMPDPDELEWEPLVSSHVDSMAFNAEDAELFVQFRDGTIYKYPADESEADGLRTAASPGRYIHYFLRHKGARIQ